MKRLIYSNFATIVIALALAFSGIFGIWLLAACVRQILEDGFEPLNFLYFGSGIIFIGISFALARVLDFERVEKTRDQ